MENGQEFPFMEIVDISYVKSFELHDMAVQHYHEGFEIYFQVDGNLLFLFER